MPSSRFRGSREGARHMPGRLTVEDYCRKTIGKSAGFTRLSAGSLSNSSP